jgi:hypothetical protein
MKAKEENIEPMSVELNKGFAIIIDDHLFDEEDNDIKKISRLITEKGIPYCGYNKLEDALKCVQNFQSVNFVILDWKLMIPENASGSDILIEANAKANVNFLREFKKNCFAPIFIFSSEADTDIIEELNTYGSELYDAEKLHRNFILIKKKADLTEGTKLFDAINDWIAKHPAVYTLKMWDNSFLTAKNDSFWQLFNNSPSWPKILWDAFAKDSVDESYNINETLYKLIKSRASLNSIDHDTLKPGEQDVFESDEIKQVMIGSMYLDNEKIPANSVEPGDIFLIEGKYYLNLRPICDTIPGRTDVTGCPTWDNELYLLEGRIITGPDVKKANRYSSNTGLIERITDVLLFGVDNNDFVLFNFNKIIVKKYEDIRDSRKQRLLSPQINNVQQKYSAYIGRFGLPRIPDVLVQKIITPVAAQQQGN